MTPPLTPCRRSRGGVWSRRGRRSASLTSGKAGLGQCQSANPVSHVRSKAPQYTRALRPQCVGVPHFDRVNRWAFCAVESTIVLFERRGGCYLSTRVLVNTTAWPLCAAPM